MSNLFFHGTIIGGITELIPFSKSHNTIKKSVVYLTPNNSYALFYIWSRPYKWVTFDIDDQGVVVFKENFENHLYEFYANVSGYIYTCDGNNPQIYKTHINSVYNSEFPVRIIGCEEISDVYSEILKRETIGTVKVVRYNSLSINKKEKINSDTVRAIHMEKLLFPSEDKKEKISFVKRKFPIAWETAVNNTDEEVNAMITEWKRSEGIL